MYKQYEDERGYLVYVNRYSGTTQHDNPNLNHIVSQINEKFITSKYTTYRCACKLFALQKALHTNHIPFQTVCSILERHCLNQVDSAPSVKPAQLTAVLHDIYFAAEHLSYFVDLDQPPDHESLISTLAGLFWAVFDPKRCNPISGLELKQTFLILCETQNIEQLVWEHFQLTSDHNLCVSRHRFEAMLINLAKILAFLGEPDHLMPSLVQEIVNECFANYPGLVGLTEYQFSCLWKLSSKFSYYSNMLTLSKRLRESELVVHNVQCTGCRVIIKGLRFKCQRCRKFSLCIECFSRKYVSKSHCVGHKMYEISTNEITTNKISTLVMKICNLFNRSSMQQFNTHQPSTFDNMEAKLIDINAVELQQTESTPTVSGTLSQTLDSINGASFLKPSVRNTSILSNMEFSSSHNQLLMENLASILKVLENENVKYSLQLPNLKGKTIDNAQLDYFHSYGKIISEQLNALHDIYTKLSRGFPQSCSTPYRSTNKRISFGKACTQAHGADFNKSSDNEQLQDELSVRDVSSWFHLNRPSETIINQNTYGYCANRSKSAVSDELSRCIDNLKIDTQMANFKDLLLKVREIVDDSYSDNTELARTTQLLEKALDRIIAEEERKRIEGV
ncbi:dystrobrevin alpha isoform X2 [Malaya genurostris]|uniref:dystrobrevin alpha isoform X2 n=1 Tax=Malaya genurostris TaxID=325434 RepID=UPI0026F3EFD8|nr:dystrobrevin alpha isoform X2 [Malaya genurostris]